MEEPLSSVQVEKEKEGKKQRGERIRERGIGGVQHLSKCLICPGCWQFCNTCDVSAAKSSHVLLAQAIPDEVEPSHASPGAAKSREGEAD